MDKLKTAAGNYPEQTLSDPVTRTHVSVPQIWIGVDPAVGFAIVPVEPTEEMIDAGEDAYMERLDIDVSVRYLITEAFKVMITVSTKGESNG